jgi:hypothetical protein
LIQRFLGKVPCCEAVLHVGLRLPRSVLKSHFLLGLLALQPAASALESIFFVPRLRPTRRSIAQVRAPQAIISDYRWSATPFAVIDRHDMTGHHRYYGRSAYVFE